MGSADKIFGDFSYLQKKQRASHSSYGAKRH
jgi:hypothetical protein